MLQVKKEGPGIRLINGGLIKETPAQGYEMGGYDVSFIPRHLIAIPSIVMADQVQEFMLPLLQLFYLRQLI